MGREDINGSVSVISGGIGIIPKTHPQHNKNTRKPMGKTCRDLPIFMSGNSVTEAEAKPT